MRKSIAAMKCTQNGVEFYLTVMNSADLNKMCFVTRRRDDPNNGFQRLLNKNRAKSIAGYLDDEKGVIPATIILSAQNNAELRYDDKLKAISLDVRERTMLVIDGQHRLYGMFEAKHNYEIPVVIFKNLNTSEEIRLFIDINTTQKGVPSALILDIKRIAGMETKLEERQRLLFDKMNEDSVLTGYLLRSESKAGKISRTVFNGSTKALFETGPVSGYSDAIIYKTLKNYLEAINYVFVTSENPKAKINKSVLFKAAMNIFNDVCEKCLLKYKNLKVASFQDYLAPLSELNFDEYTGTNNAAVVKVTGDMRNLLKEPIFVGEEMF